MNIEYSHCLFVYLTSCAFFLIFCSNSLNAGEGVTGTGLGLAVLFSFSFVVELFGAFESGVALLPLLLPLLLLLLLLFTKIDLVGVVGFGLFEFEFVSICLKDEEGEGFDLATTVGANETRFSSFFFELCGRKSRNVINKKKKSLQNGREAECRTSKSTNISNAMR